MSTRLLTTPSGSTSGGSSRRVLWKLTGVICLALAFLLAVPARAQYYASQTMRADGGNLSLGSMRENYLKKLNKVISVTFEDVTVEQALKTITSRADLLLSYGRTDLMRERRVNLELKNVTVLEALYKVVEGMNITFQLSPTGYVIVLPGPEPLPEPEAPADEPVRYELAAFQVSGQVTSAEDGEPLPGVNIVVKGTTIGTTTDSNGRYTIEAPTSLDTLVFSFIGYQTQEVPILARSTLNVQLAIAALELGDDIVVVGYGTQQKVNLTGAVDQVTSEALENRSIANLTQGLQGIMPNVNIRMLDGKPTETPQINIRGTTSIGQGGSALVLIDGVEGDPSMINPNDIESISVLKDAASAAVYGARGAFGVVLITTKRPQRDDLAITYSVIGGAKRPIVSQKFVTDGYTWAKMFNESFVNWEGSLPQNVNKTLTFSQEYLEELKRRSEDPSLPKTEIGPDGRYVYYHSTDWYDLLYKDYLTSMEHNLSVSRSSENASFLISGRYMGQQGLFRYSPDDYRMLNLRANGSIRLYPWLQVNNNFLVSNRTYYNPLNVGEGGGIWRNIADEGHPLAPLLNPDGTLTYSAAYTVGDFYYGKNGFDTERTTLRNTTGFVMDFFDHRFRINGDFSFQNTYSDQMRRRVQVPYSRAPGVIEYVGTQYNDIQRTDERRYYLASNLYGEYQNVFKNVHYLSVTAGVNYENSQFERLMAERNGLIFEDARDINLALGQAISTSGGFERWAILGGFYRLNYIFGDRYLLELNGRYDGSSKFPENERYAFFPSASIGWRISQEPFWHVSPKFINELKLRGSYGSMGNGNIGAYVFQETFNISQTDRILAGVQPQYTSRPSVLPEGLTWETVTTQNLGLDLEMLDGRLQFTGDAYIRNTEDMFTIGMTLPAVFGATSPRGNYADLRTTGWELMLGWGDQFDIASKPFDYRIRFTLSDNKSVITRYNNPDKFLDDYYEGMRVGEMWGFITEGFFKTQEEIENHADQSVYRSTSWGGIFPGDIKLKDVDGDGVISDGDNTANNPGDRVIIGNSAPRYAFGLDLGASWNNFFFSAFFQGIGKQDWYPRYESNLFWGQYNRPYGDIPKWHLKPGMIWSEDNPDSFFPRYVSRLANRNEGILRQPQSKYVMNAAYCRLKNLQFGYNLPRSLTSKYGARATRIYFSADNIWTYSPLYKIVDNIDVENATAPSDQLFTSSNAGDGYNYPMLKSLTLGLSVTF